MLFLSTTLTFTACSDEDVVKNADQLTTNPGSGARISEDDAQSMRKDFALALAKALDESKELRALLKKKALEMIDEDYDVLFAMIRDEVLTEKLTVRKLISKHLKGKNSLDKLEDAMPTLTIFVPKLPNNSFSAESWDTDKVVPLVAAKSTKTDDVLIVDAKGVEAVLPAKYAPGFPVIVVKNSLRIVDDSQPNFDKQKTETRLASTTGKKYRFIHDNFDRKLNLRKKSGSRIVFNLEDKIKNAYNFFPTSDAGWQRDHIYYNLTSTSTRGSFSLQFKEAITTFGMSESDPLGAYNYISDATDDPHFGPSNSTDQHTFWSSSSYTFRVRVVYNSKNGTGTEFSTQFPIPASDLWDIGYEAVAFPGFWPWETNYVYFPNSITSKTIDLRQGILNQEIFNWDLASYATTVLVKFEEVDTQRTVESTVGSSETYAGNFGFDGGIFAKIGLKFGASATTTLSNSTKITTLEGSDELGTTIVNFGDAIVIGNPMGIFYDVREYPCGFCRFTMRPVQVQP